MRDCLIMPDCAHSLCPVPLVCEEEGWGYQTDQGNIGSRFTARGETMVQLENTCKGGMAVLPEEMVLPAPREVHQLEVAGVAPARCSWEHMRCWLVLARGRGVAARGSWQCEHRGAGVRGSWGKGAVSRGSWQ